MLLAAANKTRVLRSKILQRSLIDHSIGICSDSEMRARSQPRSRQRNHEHSESPERGGRSKSQPRSRRRMSSPSSHRKEYQARPESPHKQIIGSKQLVATSNRTPRGNERGKRRALHQILDSIPACRGEVASVSNSNQESILTDSSSRYKRPSLEAQGAIKAVQLPRGWRDDIDFDQRFKRLLPAANVMDSSLRRDREHTPDPHENPQPHPQPMPPSVTSMTCIKSDASLPVPASPMESILVAGAPRVPEDTRVLGEITVSLERLVATAMARSDDETILEDIARTVRKLREWLQHEEVCLALIMFACILELLLNRPCMVTRLQLQTLSAHSNPNPNIKHKHRCRAQAKPLCGLKGGSP
jgi:hypothetical protein